jgi:hypothetical protein
VPALDDLDGDMVVVEFMDGEIDSPIITGAITHEQSNRRVIKDGTGWSEGGAGSERGHPEQHEHYVHWKGCELRINDAGDLLIDTVGAYSDPKTEDPAGGAGQVRIRIKDEQKFTVECDGQDVLEVFRDGTGIHVHLGEAAIEQLIFGTTYRTEETVMNTALQLNWATVGTALTSAAGDPVLVAIAPIAAAGLAAAGAVFTLLGTPAGAIGVFESKALTYLSDVSKTE